MAIHIVRLPLFLTLFISCVNVHSYKPNVTVAIDGSGNFNTINEAISKIPIGRNSPYVILIKQGTYNEAVYIAQNMSNLVLIGEGMEKTIVQFNKTAKQGYGTSGSATVDISANDVFVKGIRFVNNAGPDAGQAVALRVAGDRIAIYQCSIQGYQDTLLTAYGIHFFRECEVYGTVDFIFGNSRVVLQNCDIYVRKRTEGTVNMITAQGRGQVEDTGIVLHNCSIKADKDLQPYPQIKTFLGRPWYSYSQTIVMECFLDKLVDPEGWLPNNDKKSLSTLHHVEYANWAQEPTQQEELNGPGIILPKILKRLNILLLKILLMVPNGCQVREFLLLVVL
ncbi:pectinesterase [Quercus suber]|uniref:pectinesterase n=1 Tax=Quercus suber TaxID=58331 RepID=UPI0032DFE153